MRAAILSETGSAGRSDDACRVGELKCSLCLIGLRLEIEVVDCPRHVTIRQGMKTNIGRIRVWE